MGGPCHRCAVVNSLLSCAHQVFVLEEPALVQLEVRNCMDRVLSGLLLRQPEGVPSSNMVLQVFSATRHLFMRHSGRECTGNVMS